MLTLPTAIRAYFDLPTDAPVETLGTVFTPDAHVRDEARDYHGLDEIGGWRIDTQSKTPFLARPVSAQNLDGATVVTAEVSGAFPGSPIMLDHTFRLIDDRIVSLSIR